MSEEVQTPQQEPVESQETITQENPKEDVNTRLLEESKRNKSRFQEMKAKYEKLQNELLEKEGDVNKKLEFEKSKNAELLQSLNKERNERIKRDVKLLLSKHAKDAVDVDDLVMHPKVKDMVHYDEDSMEVDEESIKEAVKVMRESKPHFFSAQGVKKQINRTPTDLPPEKPLSDKEKFSASIKGLFS